MKAFHEGGFWILLVAFCSGLVISQPCNADVETLLAEINQKLPEERLKLLTEGAKKEGILYYYGATNLSDIQDLIRGFGKNYPFVDVRYTRLGGPSVVNKVITEYRAGVFNVDVLSMRGTFIPELAGKKIIARYKSPMNPVLRKGFTDSEGYLSGYYATGYTFIYNSERVKPGEVPRTYEHLLDPRWKGRLVMDREEYDWLAGMIDLIGESRAASFFRRLVEEQGLKFKRGHTLITQLVAAGEHDLLVDGYVHNAGQFKTKRAPIDFVFTNPTIVKPPSVMAIASKAPHPHAAALFLDYKLSKEGQEIMARKQSHWTARTDVKWTIEPGTELHVVSPLEWGLKYNHVRELFRKIAGP
ncbi:MAG: extracellular solute-binding protein [Deltaproteobacteria bacterium]|nr:extracellular solute-binding protein [Deltaproteobacteria bacterium]